MVRRRGSSTIARDISDRRRAEKLKDGFLSLVSHELRTPLSAIVAHVELLLDEDLPPGHRLRFVEVIHRNSVRLERLVGDLLFVAQLDRADLTVTMTDVDIVAIAHDAVEAAAPRAGASGVAIRFASCEQSVWMVGDSGRLGQAVDNLVSNAIKYSPDGGAVCVRVLPDGGECIIEVEDEGVGIAFEEQEHLFERFFRTSTAASLHIQGVGTGSDGRQDDRRRPRWACEREKRARIGGDLPDGAPSRPDGQATGALGGSGIGPPGRIVSRPVALVVDDEADIRSVITFVLDVAGFEVHEESDGEAGLVTAGLVHPDVILLDWMMPRMSGVEACRALRRDVEQDSTVVILLTAKAQESDVELGFAAGAQDYIVKPFSPRELVSRVQALLAGTG